MTDLTTLTPSEIDEAIVEIMRRADKFVWIRDDALRTARRYDRAGRDVPEYVEARIADAKARIAEIMLDAAPFEAEYDRRGGWTRFYLVKHLHRTTACSTCYPTSRFVWVPALSGGTDDDAIALHGESLCSVCFPDAPVAPKGEADPNRCAAVSGSNYRQARRGYDFFVDCDTCGKTVKVNRTGSMRKHSPK